MTFFSGTDIDELKSNSFLYNYYLSVIVNFSKSYSAKIAIPVESDVSITSWFKNTLGKLVPFKNVEKTKSILIGDLDVIIEGETYPNKWLEERVGQLEDKKKVVYPKEYSGGTKEIVTNWDNYLSQRFKKAKDEAISTINKTVGVVKDTEVKVTSVYDKFILSLLNTATFNVDTTVRKAFIAKNNLNFTQLESLEEAIDENFEIIVTNIFGDDCNFRKVCMETLLHLHNEYAPAYGKLKVFEIIDYTLSCYVAV